MIVNWKTQIVSLEVLLAIVAAALIFTSLDIVSGGLLLTVVTIAGIMIVVGLAHYFVWGRHALARENAHFFSPKPVALADEVVITLTESERSELLRLLTQNLVKGPVTDTSPAIEPERAALDRQLAEKLRMFGA